MRFTDHGQTTQVQPTNPLESTFMLADTTDRVEGFFERPQRIFTAEWTPGVSFHQVINPWELYFDNPRVSARLSNFAYLRCKMHVRIMINSTKFYYGRLMASYTPMHEQDNLTNFRPGIQADFVEASQRPSIIINPTDDVVGTLELPYMYPKSSLLIPAKEWFRMGELVLADLTVLRNANNASDPITVTVFAWATEVDYSQPTSQTYNNEAGEEEYYDGPISKPSSKVARWANHLANVPIIGLYARATEMVASTTAAVARMFGYSRPTIVAPEQLYSPSYGKRLAATNVEDTCDPLSLDIKKEIPIDPRIIGSDGTDAMAFVPIAKRETYLTSFDWNPTDAADTFLFNIHVSPTQKNFETATLVHTTPAAWIASLFEYWRGCMSIRFEVVCSGFHKGRLRIVYDPIFQTTDEYNVNYTHLVDLSNENDYTMDVGWAQNLPYLKVDHLNSGNLSFSTDKFTNRVGNGVLSVYVVNSLTQPGEIPQPVTVNVYGKMCDDFEVQGPCGAGLRDLSITENTTGTPSLPPPVLPGDSPNTNPPVTPGLDVRGPLTITNFANVETSVVISQADDIIPGAWVLGGSTADRSFINPVNVAFSGSRDETSNILDFNFFTTAPSPPDVTIDGFTLQWTPDPNNPGVSLTQFINPATSTSNPMLIDFPIPPGSGVFGLVSATVDRFSASVYDPVDSPNWEFSPNIGIQNDEFGPFVRIPVGDSIRVNNPGERFREIFASTPTSAFLDFNDGFGTTYNSTFPARSQANSKNASSYLLTNNGPDVIDVYGSAAITRIFSNEAGEEDLQEEREEVKESVAGTPENLPQVSDVFFGELPSSFRQVMKRYTLIRNLNVEENERRTFQLYSNPRNSARGQVLPTDASLWFWVMSPYLGWKGSTRHKIIPDNPNPAVVTISRACRGISFEQEELLDPSKQINVSWEGSTTAFIGRQIAEAVIPWYSNLRFRNCRIGNPDLSFQPAPAFNVGMAAGNRAVSTRQVAAGGEDYSLHYWVSTPIVTVRPSAV